MLHIRPAPRDHARLHLGAIAGASALLMSLTLPATAQIVSCSERASLSGGYKVHADDIVSVAPVQPNSDEDRLLNRIWYQLRSNFEQLRLESPKPLYFLRCKQRAPQGSQDFTPTLATALDQDNVVLEVWGRIERRADAAGTPFHTAEFLYALIPLCATGSPGEGPRGVYASERSTRPGEGPEEAFAKLDRSQEMTAYASVAIGLKLARVDRFDDAWTYLCRGRRQLLLAVNGLPSEEQKQLLAHMKATAGRLVGRARHANTESHLKHLRDEELSAAFGEAL